MNTATAQALAACPPRATNFFINHKPIIDKFINMGTTTEREVLSIIWILCAELRLTLPELAKELGVRKINGVWLAMDPVCGHSESLTQLEKQGFDLVDERDEYQEEPQVELPDGVVASTRELAEKLGITRRRAQQLVAMQVADLRSGNDLFGMGLAA
jgi:hypothetical protein